MKTQFCLNMRERLSECQQSDAIQDATKLFKMNNYCVETILEQHPNNINRIDFFKLKYLYCVHLALVLYKHF